MKLSNALESFAKKARETDSYWVEEAKLAFAVSLEERRRYAGMTYAAIAKKIGTSAAYITKIFRGDTNVTIESMVKLSRATGGRLEVRVVSADAESYAWEISQSAIQKAQSTVPSQTCVSVDAKNDNRFSLAA